MIILANLHDPCDYLCEEGLVCPINHSVRTIIWPWMRPDTPLHLYHARCGYDMRLVQLRIHEHVHIPRSIAVRM